MKYWLLTTEYPPQYGGGIGTYVFYTACMLRDKGHEVTVFLYDLSLSENNVSTENNIRLVRFVPNKTKTEKILGFNAYISYEYAHIVGEYIKNEGVPTIIESQEYHSIAYYLQQFKWLGYENFKDLKILITCHAPSFLSLEYNHVPVYQLPNYWTGQMEISSIRSADILISPSKYLVNELKQRMSWNGIQERYVINPINTESCLESDNYEDNYIICFGKLSPLKGTFQLLQYFRHLWDEGFQHPLYVIGGTEQFFHPEGMTMDRMVRKKFNVYIEKGLLRLEGDMPLSKAKAKIMKAHVVLVPSMVDNLPYTVLEAMSWGKVVLASQQGGQSEVIKHGKNGFLFDHFTPEDFQKKLLHILEADTKELKTIGINAIETIKKHYSFDAVYSLKIKIISEFLQKEEQSSFPFVACNKIAVDEKREPVKSGDLLSIIIPYYNMGDYIESCVKSIVESEYPNKEIIIVNDGSTEPKSISVLNALKETYNVIVLNKKNEGLSTARNYGATRATGNYMAFLDADDMVEKSYYHKAIKVLKKYSNVHFVGCWVKYFGNSKACWPTFNPEPPYLLIHNMVNSSALVYKKSSFLKYGQNAPELIYGMEDWDSVISMVENNCGGVVLPETLFNYRVRENSMARSFTRTKQLYLYKIIGERHKLLYNKYGNEIAQLLTANGSGLYFDNPTFETPATNIFTSIKLSGQIKEKLKRVLKKNKFTRNIAYKIYKQFKH